MGHFRFNKELSHKAAGTISQLENAFSHVFENMVFFREELDRHSGKAAAALQKKMSDNINFFGKASSCLLYFADSVRCFAKAVELTDESDKPANVQPQSRSERNHTFSAERVQSEIKVNGESLHQATGKFESNLSTLDEVLHHFDTMLREMMYETEFPWEKFDDVWSDAKSHIKSIMTELKKRVKELSANAKNIIKELKRVDNVISQQLQRVK
ncbi:hypothetical protein VJC19_00895 [Bacillus paralicheniformis]|uniref:hypothetical protein n=1 Tax=Bacillus TaxID=1386 RepID=UPI000408B6E8|nr:MULTISPECIES: hypothetical protein [Bacillus]MCJ8220671.1 hypothetical protein [Bacillus paralicheniformis]MCY8038730.1 hypothetical protein [Bacillus paralicheniformis]MEB3126745.1 hypothetical protein [Bacillus paralicheniformis]MED1127946.1 hypothetical protein [Bacillus paralicheniformis]MED1150593.1 hypothetical protein [Bacillus paralicheniformis]